MQDKHMCRGYVVNGIIERCSGALLRQLCHLCNIKSSSSPALHCPLTESPQILISLLTKPNMAFVD